jgi:hypothetical protein
VQLKEWMGHADIDTTMKYVGRRARSCLNIRQAASLHPVVGGRTFECAERYLRPWPKELT